jgi:drug/metabolite transporter (DMT)-like permease
MSSQKHQLDSFAIVLLVILCASWGIQQITIKLANHGISPVLQGGIRSIGAAVFIWGWMLVRRIPILEKDASLIPGIAAGVIFSVEFLFIYWGLAFTTASRAVIFLYTMPFMVALGAQWFIPTERIGTKQLVGMCCAFLGILFAFRQAFHQSINQTLIGDAMLVVGAVLWAATTILIKASILVRIHPAKTLFYQLVVSGILLPLGSVAMGEPGIMEITPLVAGCIAYQIVWVAFITYLAWFWLIQHYPAPRLASFMFLTPVFGVLAGTLFLKETLTPDLLLTLAFVATGIFLVNHPDKSVNRSGAILKKQ